jgi:lipopolysaccharide assembly outer membrane protein LptD (OstA)
MRALAAPLVAVVGLAWAVVVPEAAGMRASAAGSSSPSPPIGLNADDIRVENRGATLLATGHVAVAYGALRVASDALRIDRPTGTATFTGHVSVKDEKGRASAQVVTLTVQNESRVTQVAFAGHAAVETPSYALLADRILADRQRGRLTATGHVTAYSQPDLIVTGAFLTYDEGSQHAVVRGDGAAGATIQNRDGRIRGTRIEMTRKTGQAVVHGPVAAEIYDATLTGADATIDLDRGTAVITGHVSVTRRQGTLLADRLTVHYRTRQFTAEGTTRMILSDLDDASSP